MQTPTLPIQINGAGNSPAPKAARQNNGGDDGQFSAALSREVGQRQKQDLAPAAPKSAAPAKPQQAQAGQSAKVADKPVDKSAQKAGDKPAAGEPARSAGASAEARDAATEDSAAAAAAAATTPLDMLALVASLTLPGAAVAAAAAPVIDAAAAALATVATRTPPTKPGLDGEAVLTGAATLPVATDGASKPQGSFGNMMASIDALPDSPKPVDDDAGFPLGQQVQRLAVEPADANPRAAAPDGAGQARPGTDLSQLVSQRPREFMPANAAAELPVSAPATAALQQAAPALAQAAGLPADKISARVGTPAWDNQVGQKVVWMIAGKEQSATLTLNPPDMGPMQVVLSVTNDQASVTFSAAQPEVRQALEDAMPKLREMMNESGIALGNTTVNDGARDQQQAQADARQGKTGLGGRGGPDTVAETETVVPLPRRSGGGQGMVDTFA